MNCNSISSKRDTYSSKAEETDNCRKRILIVDDDRMILQVFTRILQRAGFEVDSVETGRDAFERVRKNCYNVALLDVKLPDIDGIELLMRIGAKGEPHLVKIMVTGSPSEEDKSRALKHGAAAYLTKPVKPMELLQTIEANLKS